MRRLLAFFTFLDLDEIDRGMAAHEADPGQRVAQRTLADDVTARVHGADAVQRVRAAAEILVGGGDLRGADEAIVAMVAAEVPTVTVSAGTLDAGMPIVDALVLTALAASKGDARRGLDGGGFSVNGVTVAPGTVVAASDLLAGRVVLLRKGKRNWAAIRVCD